MTSFHFLRSVVCLRHPLDNIKETSMKFFVTLAALCLSATQVLAGNIDYQRRIEQERVTKLPSCEAFVQRVDVCRKLREARSLAERIPLQVFENVERYLGKNGKPMIGKRSIRREFGLVVYDLETDGFHKIVLDMPLVGDDVFQPNIRTKHDPPYKVIRIKGQTFNKMVFEVTMDGRELLVYAAKHLSVPPVFRSKDIRIMNQEAETVVYLATPPYLANEGFALQGQNIALRAIEEALGELREKQVPSDAYPGKFVADVVSSGALLNLLVTEQTDPCLLQEREPGCERLLPKRLYERDEQVVDAVLTEFVINGLDAYRYICSGAAACGAYQFTNNRVRQKNGKYGPGTYEAMRLAYPLAELDPDFKRGTRGFRNSVKAAAVLTDYELSSRGVPDWVREAFMDDHQMGLLFPAAAYNGGPSQAKALARLVVEYGDLKKIKHLAFGSFPWQEFIAWIKSKGAVLKYETIGYIKKCVSNWTHLGRYERLHRRS